MFSDFWCGLILFLSLLLISLVILCLQRYAFSVSSFMVYFFCCLFLEYVSDVSINYSAASVNYFVSYFLFAVRWFLIWYCSFHWFFFIVRFFVCSNIPLSLTYLCFPLSYETFSNLRLVFLVSLKNYATIDVAYFVSNFPFTVCSFCCFLPV